jgi:ribonuclease BN (tRNA processing enzyme)
VSEGLVILGSKGGPAIRPGGPSPTASLLEIGGRRIVIDCGLGVSRGLVEAGMELPSLDLVLITHLHSDHVLELGPLLHTAWTAGLKPRFRSGGQPERRLFGTGFCPRSPMTSTCGSMMRAGPIFANWCASSNSAKAG